MTPSGIEPATFQFVAQHLNHCATAVPLYVMYYVKISENYFQTTEKDVNINMTCDQKALYFRLQAKSQNNIIIR